MGVFIDVFQFLKILTSTTLSDTDKVDNKKSERQKNARNSFKKRKRKKKKLAEYNLKMVAHPSLKTRNGSSDPFYQGQKEIYLQLLTFFSSNYNLSLRRLDSEVT